MHSSRMRTGRSLTVCRSLLPGGSAAGGSALGGCLLQGCLLQGGVCPGGCLLWGVCSGGGCLLQGVSALGVSALGGVCSGGVCSGGCLLQGGSAPREAFCHQYGTSIIVCFIIQYPEVHNMSTSTMEQ